MLTLACCDAAVSLPCRNNLTVVDMVGVEGFGAQELLKVGGRLPGAGGSLRFKVPESTLMDCHRREFTGLALQHCLFHSLSNLEFSCVIELRTDTETIELVRVC